LVEEVDAGGAFDTSFELVTVILVNTMLGLVALLRGGIEIDDAALVPGEVLVAADDASEVRVRDTVGIPVWGRELRDIGGEIRVAVWVKMVVPPPGRVVVMTDGEEAGAEPESLVSDLEPENVPVEVPGKPEVMVDTEHRSPKTWLVAAWFSGLQA